MWKLIHQALLLFKIKPIDVIYWDFMEGQGWLEKLFFHLNDYLNFVFEELWKLFKPYKLVIGQDLLDKVLINVLMLFRESRLLTKTLSLNTLGYSHPWLEKFKEFRTPNSKLVRKLSIWKIPVELLIRTWTHFGKNLVRKSF